MSDGENFVARWSRLKRDTAKEKTEAHANPDPAHVQGGGAQTAPSDDGRAGKTADPPEPAFDPAKLPPLESITADSDISAFLQSGVPAELTRAALRRVWTADPAIRDFIGLAENQWDFTDPTAMAGFGPLDATDNVREFVAQAMGKLGHAAEEASPAAAPTEQNAAAATSAPRAPPLKGRAQVAGMPKENQQHGEGDGTVEDCSKTVSVAPQHVAAPAEDGPAPNRRAHGRALPQ